MSTDLTHPGAVLARLEQIEHDLSERQGEYERAAFAWYRAKRELEHDIAVAYLAAEGTVDERRSKARKAVQGLHTEEEAQYEAIKAAVRVLETRASIGMAILKSQGRS